MVCAGKNELSIPDFQPSDRCGLQAHQLLSSSTSIAALSSAVKQPGHGRCLTVCRAAATLKVCAERLEPPWPGSHQSHGPFASLLMKPGARPIAGSLPAEWQAMGALGALDLTGNALSGTLPEG